MLEYGFLLLGFFVGWLLRTSMGPAESWKHTLLTGVVTLFQEGSVAFKRGESFDANPYTEGSVEFRAWAFGWMWQENQGTQ